MHALSHTESLSKRAYFELSASSWRTPSTSVGGTPAPHMVPVTNSTPLETDRWHSCSRTELRVKRANRLNQVPGCQMGPWLQSLPAAAQSRMNSAAFRSASSSWTTHSSFGKDQLRTCPASLHVTRCIMMNLGNLLFSLPIMVLCEGVRQDTVQVDCQFRPFFPLAVV